MPKKRFYFVMTALLTFALLALSQAQPAWADPAGRIVSPGSAGRCSNNVKTTAECEARRQKALQRGCITNDEYDALVRYNSYPTCDWEASEPIKMLESWCPCGCLHPDTALSVVETETDQEGEVSARDLAAQRESYRLITLSSQSSLNAGSLSYDTQKVVLSTVGPSKRDLIEIRTLQGTVLKVTPTHPIVLASGAIKQASQLKASDLALGLDGQAQDIVSVQKVRYTGPVFNFATGASLDNPWGHVMFGQGLAIGDLSLEALLSRGLRSVELRR